MSSNVNRADVFHSISVATKKTTAVIILMNSNAAMLLVLLHSLLVPTVDAYRQCGNATVKMIAVMDRTKAISVPKKLVLTSNSLVQELATVFLNLGYVQN